jgi:hypothetical protein
MTGSSASLKMGPEKQRREGLLEARPMKEAIAVRQQGHVKIKT